MSSVLTLHDDVLQVTLSTRRSRLVGYAVSVYVVRGALVDTGFHAVRDDVVRLLDERPPRGAFVSHWHEDHAGNVELLASRGIPLALAAETEARVRRAESIGVYRRMVWQSQPALRAAVVPFAPDDLAFLPAPGHSPDHHVVWDASRRTLFAGDLFLGIRVRHMHRAEDPYAIVGSLRAAAALAPARLFCAHRGFVTRPVDALLARARWLEDTMATIARQVDAGDDDAAIVRAVLGGEDFTSWVSRGEYARANLVAAVRRARSPAADASR